MCNKEEKKLTPEEKIDTFHNVLKRNIYVTTDVIIEMPSPWARIKVRDLQDCELKRTLLGIEDQINKLLKPYAHIVMSETLEQALEENENYTKLVEEQFDKLKEVLNPPMTQEESDAREDGYVFRDPTFKKFDNVEPEPFPMFMGEEVSFDKVGGLIIIKNK